MRSLIAISIVATLSACSAGPSPERQRMNEACEAGYFEACVAIEMIREQARQQQINRAIAYNNALMRQY